MSSSVRTVRRATAVRATGLVVGSLFVLAPVGVTPEGCGELSGGRLCVEGPIGGAGTFTTRYDQHPGRPEIAVRLGYQRKDARITAFPGWFGTRTTRQGHAELTGTLDTEPGECVRGVMEDERERLYVTGWRCS
ncbi:hypothetical protein [Streptomyces paludis]|uniref:Uncharacterized protein n=1 Tax=Streptomyces paludis TaxID=2282738 RepID=A0A345HSW4_9ACTN|nr:hypothetical protein [Streptomyces paludis]AXG79788.1 hypothetical protein DVK44_21435 [Streptomyces paludis]